MAGETEVGGLGKRELGFTIGIALRVRSAAG